MAALRESTGGHRLGSGSDGGLLGPPSEVQSRGQELKDSLSSFSKNIAAAAAWQLSCNIASGIYVQLYDCDDTLHSGITVQVVLQRRPAIEALAAAMLRDNLDEPIPGSVIVDIIERSPLDQVEEFILPTMLVSTWVLGIDRDISPLKTPLS